MTTEQVSLDQVLRLARQLSPLEKVKLIEQVIPDLEDHLRPQPRRPLRSVYGLCAVLGAAPSAEDIDEMRREIFSDFAEQDSRCWLRLPIPTQPSGTSTRMLVFLPGQNRPSRMPPGRDSLWAYP